MDAGTWATAAVVIITGGAEAVGTIMAGATIVITKTFAIASPLPGRVRRF
jgi:hypothetical protein